MSVAMHLQTVVHARMHSFCLISKCMGETSPHYSD